MHRKEFHARSKQVCDECSREFTTKYILAIHLTVEHNRLDFLHIVEKKAKARKTIKCTMCYKKFKTEAEMEKHRLQDHTELSKVCTQCGERFSTTKILVQHVNNAHKRVKYNQENKAKFVCKLCGASFPQRFRLRVHEGNVHGVGQVNFRCSHCLKCFNRRYEFELHQYAHTDKKPFQCLDCDQSFKRAAALKLHRRNKHNDGVSDEQQFNCTLCPLAFKNKDYLRSHVRKVHHMSLQEALSQSKTEFDSSMW